MVQVHRYTPEQIAFLAANQRTTREQLTIDFNETFDTCVSQKAINEVCKRNSLKCLNNNRGGHYARFGGMYNSNTKEVGYERVNKNGFIEVRCEEKTMGNSYFRCKHILVWEQHHKKQLPPNHGIVFLDGDSRNFDIDNLILMPIGAVIQRRYVDYSTSPTELKPSINLLVKLNYHINKVQKHENLTPKPH
jgi:hypothetical protein